MKKIGILTVYTANNYGTILQALALQKVINRIGYEVEFIRIPDGLLDNKIETEKMETSKRFLKTSDHFYQPETDEYEAIIIGSDEIWNVRNLSFEHKKEYFGYGLNCNNIIAYSPSCNTTTIDIFNDYFQGQVDFSQFNSISVRDNNTQKLVKDISGLDVPILLDPTLLLESYQEYTKIVEDKGYILIYGYHFEEEEKMQILQLAKEKNLPIYSIGFKFDWVDKNIDGDITDFLGYMNNATYVVTSTFHGTVFSIILEKKFGIFARDNHKVQEVLKLFKLEKRNMKDLKQDMDKKINYKRVNSIKQKLRTESLNFLVNAVTYLEGEEYEECI